MDFSSSHLQLPAAELLAHFQPSVHAPLDVPLQAAAEVPEHGGASGEHDVLRHKFTSTNTNTLTSRVCRTRERFLYLVERAPDVDGTVLDDLIHDL